MESDRKRRRVLVVSGGEKIFQYISELLPGAEYSPPLLAKSAAEAKRMLMINPVDIMVVDAPLPDEFGLNLCHSVADMSMGIMILVKAELLEKTSARAESDGILTLQKPNSRQNLYSALKLLTALSVRLQKMETKNRTLQDKMADIRAVNRAKWLLIEKLGMTESDAHYFIEKRAMDERISRREVAEDIIRSYDN